MQQRRVAKVLGVKTRYGTQLSAEENWRTAGWCYEVKSGQQVPKVVLDALRQARSGKAIGDGRPVVVVLVPEGVSPTLAPEQCLAVMSLSDFSQEISP